MSYDPLQSYLTPPVSGCAAIFKPKTIAIIGATGRMNSVGRTTTMNLIQANTSENFDVFPVNPCRKSVLGMQAWHSVGDIPGPVDLAVVITPAKTVPAIIEECGKKAVAAVIVISAGFKEIGEEGLALETRMLETARKYNVRIVGPNCLGVMSPNFGMNATFAAGMALKGNIAFASQSGAMCTAVLDWSIKQSIGFSSFVSVGSMADVNWGDIIDYFGSDPDTHSILIYMETIGDASSFLSAAKEVAAEKPIIVIKAGKSEAAAAAAVSHTGSLAGAYDVFLAAMRRVGVMVVDTISELFNCALTLGKQSRPKGPNLLMITNAGGPGVLATDALCENGGVLATIPDSVIQKLNKFLPAAWSHSNPVDILGDASPELYSQTLEAILNEKCFDGVLIVLSPQTMTDPTETARVLLRVTDKYRQDVKNLMPIMASWMGGSVVSEGFKMLNQCGIPTFSYPDEAAKSFAFIWKNTQDLELMTETPGITVPPCTAEVARAHATKIVHMARDSGRTLLTEAESKDVLYAYGIPIAETIFCGSEEEAVAAAVRVRYPCVVKLHSETLTHKSDVGGVILNLNSESAVRAAWSSVKENVEKIGPEHFQGVTVQPMLAIEKGTELIVGSFEDIQFGPIIAFGGGGCMVEIYQDSALSLPPLNATLAQRQIEQTKIYKALKGCHGKRFPGVPLNDLYEILVRFSFLVVEMKNFISEIDINPLLALSDRFIALDARMVIRPLDAPPAPLAIRPYPSEYVLNNIKLKDGSLVRFAPSHPGDRKRFIKFHKGLSSKTIRHRYLSEVSLEKRLAKMKVNAVCSADYSRLICIIASRHDNEDEMIGICRLTRFPLRHDTAEIRLAVDDNSQGNGIGTELLYHALRVAEAEKLVELRTSVLKENAGFLKLMERVKFSTWPSKAYPDVMECSRLCGV